MYCSKSESEIQKLVQDLRINNQNKSKDELLNLISKKVSISDGQLFINDIKLVSEKQLLFIKYQHKIKKYTGITVLDVCDEYNIVIPSYNISSHTSIEDLNRLFAVRYYNHNIIICDYINDEDRMLFNKNVYKYFSNNHKEMIIKNQKINFIFKFINELNDIMLINAIDVKDNKSLKFSELKNLADKFCIKSIIK